MPVLLIKGFSRRVTSFKLTVFFEEFLYERIDWTNY